ncbi:hypothetical protein CVT24_005118, partial [Panaeolus cyanescens]
SDILESRQASTLASGYNGGYYYDCSQQGQATYTNGPGGTYYVSSSGNSQFICGKGWNPGSSSRIINYNGSYTFTDNSYLTIWGWTRSPIVEYYVVESYDSSTSPAAQKKGTVYCDGADYDILQATRVNQPSPDGLQTFQQYWSVRKPPRSPGGAISGSVDLGCHTKAWRSIGMSVGSQQLFQIVATSVYYSSGHAQITIS